MNTTSFVTPGLTISYLKGIRDINKIEKRPTYEKALAIYRCAREKLLDINAWKYDVRLRNFEYTLMDHQGNRKYGFACDGDYIRFKAEENDRHYSWVIVERILEVGHEDWKSFAVRLKSADNPATLISTHGTAQNTANTDTLIIERNGNKVVAYVHQRVIEPYAPGTQGFFYKISRLFSGKEKGPNIGNHNWETLIDIIME